MDYIYLDIETCPSPALIETYLEGIKPAGNLKDPEKIKEDLAKKQAEASERMSVDKDFCEIKIIGLRQNGKYHNLSIEQFADFVLQPNQKFVTFNGLKFDFPVIIRNLVKKNLVGDATVLRSCLDRYSGYHLDIFDRLCGFSEYRSLDHFAKIYLGKSKPPIDFQTCTDEELLEHNKIDLEYLEQLHKKFIYYI